MNCGGILRIKMQILSKRRFCPKFSEPSKLHYVIVVQVTCPFPLLAHEFLEGRYQRLFILTTGDIDLA